MVCEAARNEIDIYPHFRAAELVAMPTIRLASLQPSVFVSTMPFSFVLDHVEQVSGDRQPVPQPQARLIGLVALGACQFIRD